MTELRVARLDINCDRAGAQLLRADRSDRGDHDRSQAAPQLLAQPVSLSQPHQVGDLNRTGEERHARFSRDNRADRLAQRRAIKRQGPAVDRTAVTSALRASSPAIRSRLVMPYSWIATRWPASVILQSSASRISRQVLGSATARLGSSPTARRAATGLGPRATVSVRDNAATSSTRGWRVSIARNSSRTPTPVRKTTTGYSPASRCAAKSSAARFSSSGASRIAGAIRARPPKRSISRAVSAAIRLSNATTVTPPKSARPRLPADAFASINSFVRADFSSDKSISPLRKFLWPARLRCG